MLAVKLAYFFTGACTPKIARENGSPVFLNRGPNLTRAILIAVK